MSKNEIGRRPVTTAHQSNAKKNSTTATRLDFLFAKLKSHNITALLGPIYNACSRKTFILSFIWKGLHFYYGTIVVKEVKDSGHLSPAL